jgi:hypothetical protein
VCLEFGYHGQGRAVGLAVPDEAQQVADRLTIVAGEEAVLSVEVTAQTYIVGAESSLTGAAEHLLLEVHHGIEVARLEVLDSVSGHAVLRSRERYPNLDVDEHLAITSS